MRNFTTVIAAILIVAGCGKKQDHIEVSGEEKVIILNNLSETYSIFDPDSNTLITDVDTTGSVPNDIRIEGDVAYIVNSGFGGTPSIEKINIRDDKVLSYTPLPDGSNPWSIALSPSCLYVSLYGKNKLYKMDKYLNILDSVSVGMSPEGLIADGKSIYVACTGTYPSYTNSYIYEIIDSSGLKVTDSISAQCNPQVLNIQGDTLFALLTGDYANVKGKILKINVKNNTVFDTINTNYAPGDMYIDDNNIYIVDWNAGIGRLKRVDNSVNWIYSGTGVSRITGDVKGRVFATIFSSAGSNYLLQFTADKPSDIDSVFTGSKKGTQGLAIWYTTLY